MQQLLPEQGWSGGNASYSRKTAATVATALLMAAIVPTTNSLTPKMLPFYRSVTDDGQTQDGGLKQNLPPHTMLASNRQVKNARRGLDFLRSNRLPADRRPSAAEIDARIEEARNSWD